MRRLRDDWASIIVVLVCAMFSVLPHLIPVFPLPKSEDFEYTTVPSILLAREILAGEHLVWVPFAGLGSPWPIPMGLGHSVLFWLLAVMKPFTATAIIVWCHLVLMGAAMIALGRRLQIAVTVLPVCVLSLMLAPALEYLYSADAPTVFLSWTWLPVTFALVVFLIESQHSLQKCGLALMLGICGGLMLREGHVGVIAIYVIGFLAFLFANLRQSWTSMLYLGAAAMIAAGLAAEQLVVLQREAALFPVDLPRQQQGLFRGYAGVLWGMFARPLFFPTFKEPFLSAFARTHMTVRTVSFGVPFTVIVLWHGRWIWCNAKARPYLIAFWLCLIGVLMPKSWLPFAVSASWPLRDFVAIFGILLAGIVLTEMRGEWSRLWSVRSRWLQAVFVIVGAMPLLGGALVLNERGIFQTRDYNRLVDASVPTPYVRALRSAMNASDDTESRFIATSEASRMMDVEMLVDQGAVNNVAIAHGMSEVSFIAKGISFDGVQRSQLAPYGAIMGDRIVGLSIVDLPYDWTRDDQPLLSLLGIRAVVARADEKPLASGLELTTTLSARDGYKIAIYRNNASLPRSFAVGQGVLDRPLQSRPECKHDVLICFDVSPVVGAVSSDAFTTTLIPNGFRIAAKADEKIRSVLSVFMYRPGWKAVDSGRNPIAISNWHGLLRVEWPAAEREIVFKYAPSHVFAARKIEMAAFVAALAGILGILLAMAVRAPKLRRS